MCLCVFFFQAEDGIRYLVRSRGLGDVYKRQVVVGYTPRGTVRHIFSMRKANDREQTRLAPYFGPVSYTHLTLPTSDLV